MDNSVDKHRVFVFITGPIVRIGGSQLYILRKMAWLRSEGWRVVVFSVEHGAIKLNEFKEFEKNIHEFLGVPVQFFSERKRNAYLDILSGEIGAFSDCVIQSHNLNSATWGEVLAERMGALHIVHLLLESVSCRHALTRELLNYKLNRNQLFAIKATCLARFFGSSHVWAEHVLAATGCSVGNVIDCPCEEIGDIPASDFTILVVGRLEKPYVPHAVDAAVEFARRHSEHVVDLWVLGSAVKSIAVKRLDAKVKECGNIRMRLLGEKFPVPKVLFDRADVCLASAGCAAMAKEAGALCISIDGNDFDAIGIVGVTTNNTLFRTQEVRMEICELVEQVLIEKRYRRSDVCVSGLSLDYTRHKEIMEMAYTKEYFHFELARCSRYERVMRLLVRFLGATGYCSCVRIYRWLRIKLGQANACFNRG